MESRLQLLMPPPARLKHFCSVMHHDSLGDHFVLPGKMMWVPHSENEGCSVTFCGCCLSVALLVSDVSLLHLTKKLRVLFLLQEGQQRFNRARPMLFLRERRQRIIYVEFI